MQAGGSIVNVSSVMGITAAPEYAICEFLAVSF